MTSPLPPSARSATAAGLTEAAQRNEFALQVCSACATVQYPPRDVCANCLHDELPWQPVPTQATIVASCTLQHSNEAYFQQQLPWRIGTAKLDCGPVAIVHLEDQLATGDRANLRLALDLAGVAVLIANTPR